jgi:hypothetical protein
MNERPTPNPGDRKPLDDSVFSSPIRLYRLLLHRGPAMDMMNVIETVMCVTHLGRAEATHKMWETYHSGRSQLMITYRERAELYIEQFANRGLFVTLEPV